MSQGAGQKAFATSGGACDQQVLGTFDPGAVSQQTDLFCRKVSFLRAFDLFQLGSIPELAQPEVHLGTFMMLLVDFLLDQLCEQLMSLWLTVDRQVQDCFVAAGHAIELEVSELLEGSLCVNIS